MKWVLIALINWPNPAYLGTFDTREACEQAKVWVAKEGRRGYEPAAKCFPTRPD